MGWATGPEVLAPRALQTTRLCLIISLLFPSIRPLALRRSVTAPPRSEWRATLCQGAARASKYRASWRRGPLRQKLCSGLLEPTGPWGQESQLTLAPTGSHPHRPAGRTKIVLSKPTAFSHPSPQTNVVSAEGGWAKRYATPRSERCGGCQWFGNMWW